MALDALMVVTNPRKRHARKRRFSAKQLAAQRLFAKRAKAGTLGGRKRRRKNPKLSASARSSVHHKGTFAMRGVYRRPSKKRRSGTKYSALLHEHQLQPKRRRNRRRTNRSNEMARRRNRFKKGRKSTKARRIAKAFWKSKAGRLTRKRIKRFGLKKAMRMLKRMKRRGSVSSRKRRPAHKRHRKSIRHVRAGRIGAARKRARRSGYTGSMFLNPRRKRRGSKRRRHNPGRRRHHARRRRNLYVATPNPRRRRRRGHRRHRRNPGGIFRTLMNPFRRRRNFGGAGRLMAGVRALAGFAAVRAIPGLVARFAPGVVAQVASIGGGWGDVLVSGASLFLLYKLAPRVRRFPVVGALASGDAILGGTLSLVMDIALRVLPPNVLAMAGLVPTSVATSGMSGYVTSPMLAGWAPADTTRAISGYVTSPMLGAYVDEAGMGVDVRAAALGVDVTNDVNCPGCSPLAHGPLTMGATLASLGIPATRTKSIGPIRGINTNGVFNGTVFGR